MNASSDEIAGVDSCPAASQRDLAAADNVVGPGWALAQIRERARRGGQETVKYFLRVRYLFRNELDGAAAAGWSGGARLADSQTLTVCTLCRDPPKYPWEVWMDSTLRLAHVARAKGDFDYCVTFDVEGEASGQLTVTVSFERRKGRGRHRQKSPTFNEIVMRAERKVRSLVDAATP